MVRLMNESRCGRIKSYLYSSNGTNVAIEYICVNIIRFMIVIDLYWTPVKYENVLRANKLFLFFFLLFILLKWRMNWRFKTSRTWTRVGGQAFSRACSCTGSRKLFEEAPRRTLCFYRRSISLLFDFYGFIHFFAAFNSLFIFFSLFWLRVTWFSTNFNAYFKLSLIRFIAEKMMETLGKLGGFWKTNKNQPSILTLIKLPDSWEIILFKFPPPRFFFFNFLLFLQTSNWFWLFPKFDLNLI